MQFWSKFTSRGAVAVCLVFAAVVAAPIVFADPSVPDTHQPGPDQIVCETTSAPTGSQLGAGRVCMTQRQWDPRTQVAQEALVHRQLSGQASCVGALKMQRLIVFDTSDGLVSLDSEARWRYACVHDQSHTPHHG